MIIIVFVRKYLLFPLFLIAIFCHSEEENARLRFRKLYYSADFAGAHSLLASAFPNETSRSVWDERIHLWEDIPGCETHTASPSAARSMALARIGRFQEAKENPTEEWLSHFSRATVS